MTNEHRHTLLYVDKKSQLIYDTQLFDDYALVRPASPALYQFIEKISLSEFADRFEEFCGNSDEVRAFAAIGKPVAFTVETRN